MPWPDHFAKRFPCISFDWSPTWLLCWMPWPDHFATGLFSFLFICPAHDCFAGCLGRIILPKVSFHVCSCASHLVHCWMAWPDRFAKGFFDFSSLVSQMIALLEAWLDHFARGLLSCPFICLAHDCFAECLGRIILPSFSFTSLFICLPHGCFAGCLGRIIWPQVCFHFSSFVLRMIALLDALAGSFCKSLLSFLFKCPPHD